MNDYNCVRTILTKDLIDSTLFTALRGRFRIYWGLDKESPLKRWKLNEEGLKLREDLKKNFPFFNFERIIDERISLNGTDKQEAN